MSSVYTKTLNKLIDQFGKLPRIGSNPASTGPTQQSDYRVKRFNQCNLANDI
jgi:hypothetical protein